MPFIKTQQRVDGLNLSANLVCGECDQKGGFGLVSLNESARRKTLGATIR